MRSRRTSSVTRPRGSGARAPSDCDASGCLAWGGLGRAGRSPAPCPAARRGCCPAERLWRGTARLWLGMAAQGEHRAAGADRPLGVWARPVPSPHPVPRLRSWASRLRGFAVPFPTSGAGLCLSGGGITPGVVLTPHRVCEKRVALNEINFFWLLSNLLMLLAVR